MECNISKSIISKTGSGLEFAKRTLVHGKNVSPTPFAELCEALKSLSGLLEFGKKYNLSLTALLRVSGFGYKVIGGINKPFEKLSFRAKVLKFSYGLDKPDDLAIFESFAKANKSISRARFNSMFEAWFASENKFLYSKASSLQDKMLDILSDAMAPESGVINSPSGLPLAARDLMTD